MTERVRPSLEKIKVPRHMIPPAVLLCSRCESGTKIKTASPFAEGYHRRHDCLNPACGFRFYSLASYGGGRIQVSPLPFKDRELSPLEVADRQRWLDEEAEGRAAMPVTPQVIHPSDRFADPVVKRINDALFRAEALRDDADHFIVSVFNSLKEELEIMDAQEGRNQEGGQAAHNAHNAQEGARAREADGSAGEDQPRVPDGSEPLHDGGA